MAAVRLQVTHTTWISSFFHHIVFPKKYLLEFTGRVVAWERRSCLICFSSWENSECHLQEINYVSRCVKCNSIALWVFPLTCSFWCIRVVLSGFNQLSSYTVNLHSCDDGNLHSVISRIIISKKKHDLMLMSTWTWASSAQSPGGQEGQWPSVLYQE